MLGGSIRGVQGVRKEIKISKNLNFVKQSKHIVDHKSFRAGRSILQADASVLINGIHSGKYKIIRIINKDKVLVDFGKKIGIYYIEGKLVGPSKFGVVHCGKNGAHIVPANPVQF